MSYEFPVEDAETVVCSDVLKRELPPDVASDLDEPPEVTQGDIDTQIALGISPFEDVLEEDDDAQQTVAAPVMAAPQTVMSAEMPPDELVEIQKPEGDSTNIPATPTEVLSPQLAEELPTERRMPPQEAATATPEDTEISPEKGGNDAVVVEVLAEAPTEAATVDEAPSAENLPDLSNFTEDRVLNESSQSGAPEVQAGGEGEDSKPPPDKELPAEDDNEHGGETDPEESRLEADAEGNVEGAEDAEKAQFVDVSTEDWTERFAEAPIYIKKTPVRIRSAIPGESIKTVLRDGTDETENIAGEDQFVVTNPGGEEYITSAEKVADRYIPTDEPGVFEAKGQARILDNPLSGPIEIMPLWGKPQFGSADCKLAAVHKPKEPDVVSTDRYIIGGEEFYNTYQLLVPDDPAE